jgi:hypothetical protein
MLFHLQKACIVYKQTVQKEKIQPVENKILSRIYGKKRGWVFTPSNFLDLGSRANVGMALKNLCDRGLIRRQARGLYDYPKQHPKLGELAPTPDSVAQALAGKDSLRIQPSGAYAANLLGLTEQVPAKVIFLTDGTNRKVRIGNQEITLKQTTPKNMTTAGRVSGLVIQALRYLGKDHVDEAIVDRLGTRLGPDDLRQLVKDIRYAPAWIAAVIRRLASEER